MKYQKLVKWSFDHKRFSAAIAEWLEEFSHAELGQIVGVSKSCIHNWAQGNWTGDFTWPHMSNFLTVCDELDLDPLSFFYQEDVE